MAALTARKKRVFDSVFKKPEISEPTPVATPTGSFATLSQTQSPRPPSSGRRNAPQTRNADRSSADHVRDQVRWDRSWHTVTYYLNLPEISPDANPLDVLKVPSPPSSRSSFNDALKDVLTPRSRLPFALHTEDLLEWHTQLVRRHFLQQILPALSRFSNEKSPKKLLLRTVSVLDAAQQLYHHGLSIVLEEVELIQPGYTLIVVEKFRRDFHAIVSNSLMGKLTYPMRTALTQLISEVLGLRNGDGSDAVGISRADARTDEVCNELLDLIKILHKVGLAGEDFQVIFAEIMNRSMTDYVHRGCKELWSSNETYDDVEANKKRNSMLPRTAHHVSPSRCVTELCRWIEERYSKLAVLVFKILDNAEITGSDREKWKEMSIGRLAALRIEELFDIVLSWPNNNEALHDLRTTITSPQRRLHLTEAFASTLKERLLHPGASTLLILQTYISMIWSFHSLDHSKVLLDRVAYPLQLYLCSREDTVRIVISGLLSETEDAQGNPIEPGGDKLIELAQLLNDESQQAGQKGNDDEMDWHDMDWVPDPVDAGPGYKRSKSADIIGTLIGVLGSQEVFIKEFQNIIGENLLKNEGSFEKEVCSISTFLFPYTNQFLRSKFLSYSKLDLAKLLCRAVRSCLRISSTLCASIKSFERLNDSIVHLLLLQMLTRPSRPFTQKFFPDSSGLNSKIPHSSYHHPSHHYNLATQPVSNLSKHLVNSPGSPLSAKQPSNSNSRTGLSSKKSSPGKPPSSTPSTMTPTPTRMSKSPNPSKNLSTPSKWTAASSSAPSNSGPTNSSCTKPPPAPASTRSSKHWIRRTARAQMHKLRVRLPAQMMMRPMRRLRIRVSPANMMWFIGSLFIVCLRIVVVRWRWVRSA
jgi:hypothetical protein